MLNSSRNEIVSITSKNAAPVGYRQTERLLKGRTTPLSSEQLNQLDKALKSAQFDSLESDFYSMPIDDQNMYIIKFFQVISSSVPWCTLPDDLKIAIESFLQH